MGRYILKRLLIMIPIILGVTFIVFTILNFTPGDPVKIKLGHGYYTQQDYDKTKAELGLDKPFLVRYGKFCYDAFIKFDLGNSYNGRSVMTEIAGRFPNTFLIAMASMFLAVLIGIPLGIFAAINQSSWKDNTSMVVALFGVSMPDFWVGLMLSIIFALKLGWLPASGFYGPKYWVLPILTCSFGTLANIARMTRSSMLEVIRQDYITTARAKGMSESMIIIKHALKNALIPIITVVGTNMSYMMGGVMVTETVFSVAGTGTLMMQSIKALDYPMVLGCVLFISVFASIAVLLTDIMYAFVDPRIRAQYKSSKMKKIRTNPELNMR